MPLPSLADHRAQVRAHLDALTSTTYTDDEINLALITALGVLARYVPILRTITRSVTAGQTQIDVGQDAPPEAVTEIIWPNGASTTEFVARAGLVITRTGAPAAGNAAIVYRHQPWAYTNNTMDWYPHHYRAAVVMHAAGSLALGRAIGLAETDPAKAAQIAYAAQRMIADAMAMFRGDTQPYFTRT